MAKLEKETRPRARTPRGFRDRLGAEIAAEREMLARLSSVFERWGFEPLETPAFEYSDALGKFLPDDDRPNQGVFSLQDDDEQWMSLRYDLTAPLARFVAENYDALAKPFRRYQIGTVWRNEKPGPGRYREFTQCDADTVGAPAPYADAEACALFAEVIEAAGVPRGDYVIRVCDRRVLDGVLEANGVVDEKEKAIALRALDKRDRLGAAGVRALLGPGRKDESGDFTKGAGLKDAQIDGVMSYFDVEGKGGVARETGRLDAWSKLVDRSRVGGEGLQTLQDLLRTLRQSGFGEDRIVLDPSVVRGLDYYTGPVFEADLTFEAQDEKGRPVRFGSVGGGGRYDDLVKRFKGVEVPAVGFSVGVSRLLAALAAKRGSEKETQSPVVVLALESDEMPAYQIMAAELRAAGVTAEVYLGGAGMKAQLKYADKRGAPVAVICGGDERAKGEVTVKDLVLGAELSKAIEDNAAWRGGQPAQVAVPRAKLVAAVKEALARRR